MLKTRCILSERQPDENLCISVMSRHTLSDGITPDPRITTDKFDQHLTDLAPSSSLVGRWYRGYLGKHDLNNFENHFAPEYLRYLEGQKELLRLLGQMALINNISFLCIEPEPKDNEILLCHRRLLAEQCKILIPELIVEIH